MAWWNKNKRESKESATGRVMMTQPNQPVWSNRNYAAFAKEGYQQNVVAYQAINKIAEAVASVEWEVWKGDTQLSESPLLDLLAQPNPMQSGSEFMQAMIGYYLIAGNAYNEKVVVSGELKELYTLRPDRMTIAAGAHGYPKGYVYKVNNRTATFDVDDTTLASDILHMKAFNPLDDWYGLSPIEAGAYAIDQNSESMKHMQALLQNGATPSGALVYDDDNKGTMDEENFNRLKAQTEEQYQGSKNAGRPMLLEGGLTWQQMGLSPTDVGILGIKDSSARDISLAFGVPPQMLGIQGDSTYSNYKEARLAFWEDTVIPLVTRTAGDFNQWLSEEFGGVELRPNLDKIPAIVDKRMTLWDMADKSADLTINEKRALKGYEETDGGDALFVDASKITLQDASVPFSEITADADAENGAPSPVAVDENIQAAVLNSAQISSLNAIAQSVADQLLPAATARALIAAAFPSLSAAQIDDIINPADGWITPAADDFDGIKAIVYGKEKPVS